MSIYTNHEIIMAYKQAKDRVEQIVILSQLTGFKQDKIVTILKLAGCEAEVQAEKKYASPKKWTSEELTKLRELCVQGFTLAEISTMLNIKLEAVANKVAYHKLKFAKCDSKGRKICSNVAESVQID